MKVVVTINIDDTDRAVLARWFDKTGLASAMDVRRAVKILFENAIEEKRTDEMVEALEAFIIPV